MKATLSEQSSLIENDDNDQTISRKHEGNNRRTALFDKDQKKVDEILEKTTKLDKNQIMNFEEVEIRRSLFFRLYVAGTIEYGNVCIYIYIYINVI